VHPTARRHFSVAAELPELDPKKQVCDPYGLNGECLAPDAVTDLLATVDPGWSANEKATTITRSFTCKYQNAVKHDLVQPLEFMETVTNLTRNSNHFPYSIVVTPRKCAVEVTLKTIPLKGLSYDDFMLATQLDMSHLNMYK
jgi:pterin-4a-carbinolamine dehydratase